MPVINIGIPAISGLIQSGGAFQATSTTTAISQQNATLSQLNGFITFPLAPSTASTLALAALVVSATANLGAMSAHVASQLAGMPDNLNIFANHNRATGAGVGGVLCPIAEWFGSVVGDAIGAIQAVGGAFQAILNAINAAIVLAGDVLAGITSFILTTLDGLIADATALVNGAIAVVNSIISAELAVIQNAINDLINSARAALLNVLDPCAVQVLEAAGTAALLA